MSEYTGYDGNSLEFLKKNEILFDTVLLACHSISLKGGSNPVHSQ